MKNMQNMHWMDSFLKDVPFIDAQDIYIYICGNMHLQGKTNQKKNIASPAVKLDPNFHPTVGEKKSKESLKPTPKHHRLTAHVDRVKR